MMRFTICRLNQKLLDDKIKGDGVGETCSALVGKDRM